MAHQNPDKRRSSFRRDVNDTGTTFHLIIRFLSFRRQNVKGREIHIGEPRRLFKTNLLNPIVTSLTCFTGKRSLCVCIPKSTLGYAYHSWIFPFPSIAHACSSAKRMADGEDKRVTRSQSNSTPSNSYLGFGDYLFGAKARVSVRSPTPSPAASPNVIPSQQGQVFFPPPESRSFPPFQQQPRTWARG